MRSGPMFPHLAALAAELQRLEYSRKSIRRQLRNADSFGRWLAEKNLGLTDITDVVVDRYIAGMHHSPREGYTTGYRATAAAFRVYWNCSGHRVRRQRLLRLSGPAIRSCWLSNGTSTVFGA